MAWCEGRERFPLNAANVELRFWGIYIYIWHEWGNVAILSEWAFRLVVV